MQNVGSEHYVTIMSFVDKEQLEPGCAVLLNHKTHSVIGVLADDTDPMVSVMKLEKAPQETYADVGGLDQQIQEIKESVELPLTHPEYYEEMGIKPPKGKVSLFRTVKEEFILLFSLFCVKMKLNSFSSLSFILLEFLCHT